MKRIARNTLIIALLIVASACFTLIFVIGTEMPAWLGAIVIVALGGTSLGSFLLAEKIYKATALNGGR